MLCSRIIKGIQILVPVSIILSTAPAEAASFPSAPEGSVNFYKHTGPSDDVYTASPSTATIQFMNGHWPRLMTYASYWNQGNKLSWYPAAWAYQDAYAIYADPNNTYFASMAAQHPNWILRDSNGNPLYINYACGGGRCTQFAANISDPNGFRAWWISQAQSYFAQNPAYKGIFIDDVNLDLSRVSDGYGNVATPVDPPTGQPMTNSAWRGYFADFMLQVRNALPGAEIVHNSIWCLDWSDPNIGREIGAADWINLERGVNDPGLTGGTGYWSLDRFLSFVDYVHSYGKGVIFDGEAPASDSDAAREYSAAAYLLISTGRDLVGDASQTPSYWWKGFDTNLGAAQGSRYGWQNLLRRDFAGGMTLVNPPGSSPVTVALGGWYRRVDGSVINTITLGPAQGAILNISGSSPFQTAAPQPAAPGSSTQWSNFGGWFAGKAAISRNVDGRLELFVRGGDNAVWHRWQTSADGAWSGWYSLGGSVTGNPEAVVNADGRLEVFATGADGGLWHNWQVTPGGNWSTWSSLGGVIWGDPSAAVNADGRLEVFAEGTDTGLWHLWQATAGGNWSSWSRLGGSMAARPVPSRNADGRLEVFARGVDNRLWHIWQIAAGGNWSAWTSMDGVIISNPAVIANAGGRLEAFALGADNAVWHLWQTTPGGPWSAWSSLGGSSPSGPAVAINADGRLELFARGGDNSLWHIWQLTAGGNWAGWSPLGGVLAGEPSPASNLDGRLQAFVQAPDNSLWSVEQAGPGNWQ